MGLIKESFLLAADNADIFAAPSRLAAIPSDGVLSLEMSASQCSPTNHALVTLQLPGGDIPFENLHIPFSGNTTEQTMDNDLEMLIQVEVKAGGHVLLSYDEVGTVATMLVIATLTF